MTLTKQLLPVVAALILTSCTEVHDFGAYWAKGFVDPALQGTWQRVGLAGEPLGAVPDAPGADVLVFTNDAAGSYSLQSIKARTLKIGDATFLMLRPEEGQSGDAVIERYEIKGTTLLEYRLNNAAAVDLLEAEYPQALNIKKNQGEGRYVVIETFDGEVFRFLSRIVDNPDYWELSCQYTKASS